MARQEPWKVSLHGGHSVEFCDHAHGTLQEMLETAVTFGYQTFGVTEHAPRIEARFLYSEEIERGWDVPKIQNDFVLYAKAVRDAAVAFADRLEVLCGFEIEVVPQDRYVEVMDGYRKRFGFDYMVGSVHYVDEMQIDGPQAKFDRALDAMGGVEPLAVRYYEAVAEMVEALHPEVIGHLDLIRRNAPPGAALDTPAIRRAARAALAAVHRHGGILDVNTAGYRKGLGTPYPAPWLVQEAQSMGVGLCFGDDSHSVEQVGAGIVEARRYLIDNGVTELTVLRRRNGQLCRDTVPLL